MNGFTCHLPVGAELVAPDRTRFRWWAPALTAARVEIEGHGAVALRRGEDGLFTGEAACGAGARYRYCAGDRRVPDPAARAQADGVHGASLVVDPRAYRWRLPQWRGRPWHEMVIYELHVGCCGGFDGVAARLPALAALGITAVELMPIAEFPGRRNWGYDGALPFAPATAYGSPEQLKALVDRAHELGLCIYLDVVYNHFGPEGNYLHQYAPDFFAADTTSPWGAAIDFHQPRVREFFTANALYWLLEYRFDGLRLDAVHAINDPGWLDELAATVHAAVEPGRRVHLMLENEHNAAAHLRRGFNAQWNDDAHNALHVLLTGEVHGYYANFREAPARKLARCLAEGFAYQGEISPSHGAPRGDPSADLWPARFIVFLQNHDQVGNRALGERLTTLADAEALRAAVALQLLCPQIPLLFMGEEWGSRRPFLFFTDFHDELADAVREGRRREFAAFPAFADAAARARIPDPNAPATFAQSQPDDGDGADATDRRAFYTGLLRLRRERIVPGLPGCRSLGAQAVGPAQLIAAWRLGDGAVLYLAVNLDAADRPAPAGAGELLFESRAGAGAAFSNGQLMARSTAALLAKTDGGTAPVAAGRNTHGAH